MTVDVDPYDYYSLLTGLRGSEEEKKKKRKKGKREKKIN